jgi:predicted nucleic acid-binding protein
VIAYFDTSALMKLVVPETGSRAAVAAFDEAHEVLASHVIYPEARAASAAAVRDGRQTRQTALYRLHHALRSMRFIAPRRDLLWTAGDLAERHGLRGYDAVHLASALDLKEDVVLVASDLRLLNAARAERLKVLLPS